MVWRQLVGCNEDDGAWSSALALLAWHKRTRVDTGRWEDKTQDQDYPYPSFVLKFVLLNLNVVPIALPEFEPLK